MYFDKHNLSKYISLEEDNFTKEYSNDIYSIIESISINTDENNTYIDLDNNFKIGIIKGITNTEYELKYIGSKKREQYRLEKISTLENKKAGSGIYGFLLFYTWILENNERFPGVRIS